jgi:predicted double-glycine peptidase
VNATIIKTKNYLQLNLKSHSVRLLNVPDVMQATDYTCGPSSLSAVLNYYKLPYR